MSIVLCLVPVARVLSRKVTVIRSYFKRMENVQFLCDMIYHIPNTNTAKNALHINNEHYRLLSNEEGNWRTTSIVQIESYKNQMDAPRIRNNVSSMRECFAKNYFQLVCGVYACVIAQPSYHWTFNLSNCDFGFQIHSFGACVRSVRFYCFLSSSIHCETTDEYIFVSSRYVSSEMKLFYALVSSGFKYFSALLRFTLYINANTIIKRGEKNVENKQLKLSLSHFYDGISANIFMMKLVFIVRFWAMLHTICFYRFSESEFYIRVSASSSNWNLMISYDLLVPFVKKLAAGSFEEALWTFSSKTILFSV